MKLIVFCLATLITGNVTTEMKEKTAMPQVISYTEQGEPKANPITLVQEIATEIQFMVTHGSPSRITLILSYLDMLKNYNGDSVWMKAISRFRIHILLVKGGWHDCTKTGRRNRVLLEELGHLKDARRAYSHRLRFAPFLEALKGTICSNLMVMEHSIEEQEACRRILTNKYTKNDVCMVTRKYRNCEQLIERSA